MTWLKPTPFGPAQSSTARHSAVDCETSASRPLPGVRWAREALRPSPGTIRPNDPGPSTRTPVRRASSVSPPASGSSPASVGPSVAVSLTGSANTIAAKQPLAASAGSTAATLSGSASTAKSGATGRSATVG